MLFDVRFDAAQDFRWGALPVNLAVDTGASLPEAAFMDLLTDAIFASPANGLLFSPIVSTFRAAKNGVELDLPDLASPERDLLAVPSVAHTYNSPGVGAGLLEKTGPSPKPVFVTKHPIHVGVTTGSMPDGLLETHHRLFTPRGSEWRFVSEEYDSSDEPAKAPDANCLISAGIGFCFMTQLGILIDLFKLDVAQYQIVQDITFSSGGATGRTGKAGRAYGVETHVHLETDEDSETVRELIQLAERACYLHAMVRGSMKPVLRLGEA